MLRSTDDCLKCMFFKKEILVITDHCAPFLQTEMGERVAEGQGQGGVYRIKSIQTTRVNNGPLPGSIPRTPASSTSSPPPPQRCRFHPSIPPLRHTLPVAREKSGIAVVRRRPNGRRWRVVVIWRRMRQERGIFLLYFFLFLYPARRMVPPSVNSTLCTHTHTDARTQETPSSTLPPPSGCTRHASAPRGLRHDTRA